MKKKLIPFILALAMFFSLCGCGGGSSEPEVDISENIRIAVQAEAAVEVMFNYGDVKNVMASVSNEDDNGDGTYDVNGYITVIDNYGDTYKAKYDAVVSVDEDGDADCDSFDMDTPTK